MVTLDIKSILYFVKNRNQRFFLPLFCLLEVGFLWYMKRISSWAALGFVLGLCTYQLQRLIAPAAWVLSIWVDFILAARDRCNKQRVTLILDWVMYLIHFNYFINHTFTSRARRCNSSKYARRGFVPARGVRIDSLPKISKSGGLEIELISRPAACRTSLEEEDVEILFVSWKVVDIVGRKIFWGNHVFV